MSDWLDKELSTCLFTDKRLNTRFKWLIKSLYANHGKSIPQIFHEWGAVKAAYRFISNKRVDENNILEGHFTASRKRMESCPGPVLLRHDTTEFS